jgi:hypothetical protein
VSEQTSASERARVLTKACKENNNNNNKIQFSPLSNLFGVLGFLVVVEI